MKFHSRPSRSAVQPQQKTAKLHIDHLEDRLTPSAFGPADGAYIVESWTGNYNDVKIQPSDQKIVAVGTSSNMMAIARYDSQGNTDTGFGTNGVTSSLLGGSSTRGLGLAVQADGKAIVTGNWVASGAAKHFIARIKTNGAFDSAFGSGGWTTVDFDPSTFTYEFSDAVALQSTGKAVLASSENTSNSVDPAVLARFTTNGAMDTGKNGFGAVVQNKAIGYTFSTFGGGNSNSFYDVAVQTDDKVVAVGNSQDSGTLAGPFLLARYTASGVLDTTFNGTGFTTLLPAGTAFVASLAVTVQGDGKILTSGSCLAADGTRDLLVARFNANGTRDTTFGGGAGYVTWDIDGAASATNENGRDVIVQTDGKIVVAGWEGTGTFDDGFNSSPAPKSILVMRFNSDGSVDNSFAPGGFRLVAPQASHTFWTNAVALQANGNIIVAGYDNDGTNNYPMLMRFFGTASPLNAASTPTTTTTQTLTQAQIAPLLTEAIARWKATGADTSSLKNINIQIADLPGTTLGQAQGNTITLDSNAAGWGWFVDKTPKSDSEFRTRGNQGEQGRMDLLSVLQHEVGHVLGFDHQQSGIMADTLFAGARRMPHHAINSSGQASVDILSIIGQLHTLHNRLQ